VVRLLAEVLDQILDRRIARPAHSRDRVMYKLIGIMLAAVPIVLFLRAIFTTQSKKRSQAVSKFKKQIDYLVWAILFLIGCEVVYFIGTLILN
jgi:hypothetical protein